jgi:hypothetical protein
MHKWINKSGPGRAKGPPGPLSPGYFNPIKNTPNRKNRFVKTPLFPSPFGQNKTSKLSQNNVVINSTMTALIGLALKSFRPFLLRCSSSPN